MDYCEVNVENWAKFNPRTDVKKPSWFRLENSIFEDPDFYGFSHEELCAMLYIFCMASKKNDEGLVRINFFHMEKVGRIDGKVFKKAAEKLVQLGVITVENPETLHSRDANGTDANATNETGRTGRDETNELIVRIFEHWNAKKIIVHKFTKKNERKIEKGLRNRKDCKPEEIEQAIDNYHFILDSKDFQWSYKWALWEFLERANADKFFPEEFDEERFTKASSNAQNRQNKVANMENPYAA